MSKPDYPSYLSNLSCRPFDAFFASWWDTKTKWQLQGRLLALLGAISQMWKQEALAMLAVLHSYTISCFWSDTFLEPAHPQLDSSNKCYLELCRWLSTSHESSHRQLQDQALDQVSPHQTRPGKFACALLLSALKRHRNYIISCKKDIFPE